MNKAILIGRLTRDPELKTTGSGVNVCTFSLAIDRTFKDANGEKQTDFLNIVCWRVLADLCSKHLRKGSQCAVTGSIQVRNYEDKDGNKRTATEIVADGVEFLGSKPAGTEGESLPFGNAPKKSMMDSLTPVVDDDLPF